MKKPSPFLKISGTVRVFVLFVALIFFSGLNVFPLLAGDILLHDNGPLITSIGDGPEGSDVSLIQTTDLGLNTTGFAVSSVDNARVADDFEVTHPDGWKINKVVFFAYQIDSGTVSPMNKVNFRIWDGHPGDQNSNVIFGDTETNRMESTGWTNIYRYSDLTQLENRTRWPIMEVTADVGSEGLELTPGTYWLDWQIQGEPEISVFQPPVTRLGEVETGNAVGSTNDEWSAMLDFGTGTAQGAPFQLRGEVSTNIVSFNPQNGSTPVPESKQVVFGQPYGDLAATARTGYTFTGWFTQAAGGELVTPETIVETARDHTLYAQWSPQYTVTFDPRGGTSPNPSSKIVTLGQAYGLLPATSRDGYFFAGWFTSPDGGDRIISGTIVIRNEDHVLYAQWSDRKIILPHLPLLLLD